jgi:hypothetical protein
VVHYEACLGHWFVVEVSIFQVWHVVGPSIRPHRVPAV